MRTIRRTIILLGCVGFVALYLLQLRVALAVTPLLLVVGALTGLAVAKWLPWGWYGRQFAAGVRGGVVATGIAAAGVLLSLVGGNPRHVDTIAAASHLPGVDFSGAVTVLGGAGWFTPYVLLTAFFAVGGVLLAGIVAQVAGWNKSQRTVRVIREAHNSASLLHRAQTWAPATNSIPSIGGYWNSVLPSAGPASPISQPGLMAAGASTSSADVSRRAPIGRAPMSGGSAGRGRGAPTTWATTADNAPVYLKPLPPLDFEMDEPFEEMDEPFEPAPMPTPQAPVETSEPIPPRRTHSGVQPIPAAMSDDLQNALDRWGAEPGADDDKDGVSDEPDAPKKTGAKGTAAKPKTPAKRQPKASAYLNSDPPAAPRRSRKKQQTRDWLC
jgi:hypothetical protein